MAGRHYQCNEQELGQTPGDGEGQGSLACCSPWSRKRNNTQTEISGTFKAPSSWEEILPFMGSSSLPCSLTDPLSPRAPFQHNAPHFSGK